MKTKWKKFLNLHDKKYHIFASYCETDRGIVGELLQYLEAFKCVVSDPERDGIPGQPILRALIDKGIEQSKITILFITKHFLSDDLCIFMTNLAIWKYITTKGNHRVFPILLEPCKVPRCLKVLNCIHVWKYATNQQEMSPRGTKQLHYQFQILKRLSKAITESPPKFRRIRWNGIKTLTWTKDLIKKVKQSALKDNASKQSIPSINPFHLWRLSKVLDHCYINCRYGHCTFACSGRNFNMFINHVYKCRYKPIKCRNRGCTTVLAKWALEKHLEECRFSLITCPSDGCETKTLRSLLEQHLSGCQNHSFHCPNLQFGCDKVITRNELNAHLDTCLYKPAFCEKCGIHLLRKDFENHTQHCTKAEVICSLCKKKVMREDEIKHLDVCLMVEVICPNQGCGVPMKRYQGLQHKSVCFHRISNCQYAKHGCRFRDKQWLIESHVVSCPFRLTQCDICGKWKVFKNIENHTKNCEMTKTCELCGMKVKRSVWKTHERTCPRKNWQTYCEICLTLVKKDHSRHLCSIPNVTSPKGNMSSEGFNTSTRLGQKENLEYDKCKERNDVYRPIRNYQIRCNSSDDQGLTRNDPIRRSSSEVHRPSRNGPISSTSSDEQESETIEPTTPVLVMASDMSWTTGNNNRNYISDSHSTLHLNGCANSRRAFNDFFKAIDPKVIKGIKENQSKRNNSDFKNLKF